MKVHGQQRPIQLRHFGADEPYKLARFFRSQNPDRIRECDTCGPGPDRSAIATAKKIRLGAARILGCNVTTWKRAQAYSTAPSIMATTSSWFCAV